MKYQVKIICGFRRDQEYSIPASEAHKAYYLFFNPDSRTVFSTGLALRGDQIQEIVPDYQGTMGWNTTHVLDSDDWNDMRTKGVLGKITNILSIAKEVGQHCTADDLNRRLSEVAKDKFPHLISNASVRTGDMKAIGDMVRQTT